MQIERGHKIVLFNVVINWTEENQSKDLALASLKPQLLWLCCLSLSRCRKQAVDSKNHDMSNFNRFTCSEKSPNNTCGALLFSLSARIRWRNSLVYINLEHALYKTRKPKTFTDLYGTCVFLLTFLLEIQDVLFLRLRCWKLSIFHNICCSWKISLTKSYFKLKTNFN